MSQANPPWSLRFCPGLRRGTGRDILLARMATRDAAEVRQGTLVPLGESKRWSGPGPHAVSADGIDLVLLRTKAGPRVYQGRCPHQGALLAEGELEGETLICRNHRWQFDAVTGARQGGPSCLVACPVVESGGTLSVDLSPLASERQRVGAVGRGTRKIGDLPGPKGWPLLGNVLDLDLPRMQEITEGWAAEFGPLYHFRVGKQETLVVSDPELTESVLRARPETFRRGSNVERVFEELGVNGVFSAEGAAWRPQRRLAMEALSQRHLGAFFPTLRDVTDRLRRRWEGAARRHEPVDVVEDLKRFTVDVTTSLTFGRDMNTLEESGDDVMQRRLELMFPAFNRRIFAMIPLWRLVKLPRDRQLDRALVDLRTWLGGLVADARARVAAEPERAEHPANFLEAMLSARDDAGQPFSDRLIHANLMTMLLAGEDTTAYTLSWAVHQMCESPESVAALEGELDRVMGGEAVPSRMEVANRLAYAAAVANETMRLRPVAPLILLEAIVDTAVGDVQVPARTHVLVLTRPPVRDPRHFADPEVFRPERWIEPVGAHEPSAHLPFGSGPRICPGRSLALLEMKMVLAMVYRNVTVVRHGPASAVREHFAFTMSPTGLEVTLRLRAPG
jgi:cytochrome P450/nitrite reductase/ring-hydroxylating ferredoxin subunit